MTLAAAREKLHDIIDHADEPRIFLLLSQLEEVEETNTLNKFDEATLNMLRERSTAYRSGKSKTYTLEASRELIKQHRAAKGL